MATPYIDQNFPDPNQPKQPYVNPVMMDPNLAPPAPQGNQGAATPAGTVQSYLETLGPPEDPAQIQAKMDEAQAKIKAENERTAGNIEQNLAQQKRLLGQPAPQVPVPRLHDMPQRPQLQYRDAFQVFQNPAIIAATIGSLFTRRSAVNALTAATGALNGYMEGDQNRVALEEKNWKNAVEQTVKQNELETKEFNMIMENAKLSETDKQAKLRGLYAANQDEIGLNALRTGDPTLTYKTNAAKLQVTEKLREALIKAQTHDAMIAANTYSPESIDTLVGGYRKSGKLPPRIFQGPAGQLNSGAFLQRLSDQLKAEGKNPAQIEEEIQAFHSRAAGQRVLMQRLARLDTAIRSTIKTGDLLIESSEGVPRGAITIINRGTNEIKAVTSDPAYYQLVANINGYVNFYGQATQGGGTPRVADKEHAYDMLVPAMGTKAISAVVRTINSEMNRELESSRDSMREFGIEPPTIALPESKAGTVEKPGGTAAPTGGGWSVKVK